MKFELNLDIGRPIAFVDGGKLNGEVIHISDVDEESSSGRDVDEYSDEMDLLIRDFFGNLKEKLNFVKVDKLYKALINRVRPNETDLALLYDKALLLVNGSKGKEMIIKDGKMKLMFNPNTERLVFYITGMSGSGKSTFAGDLMSNYHKLFPKNEVYLFSNKKEDPELDKHKFMTRVEMDETLYEEPLELDLLRNSLVIFDDVEAISDKHLMKEIDRLKDLILQQGRSYHVSFIYISHLANDYRRTRTILNEAHSITVFPQMCSSYSLKYLLEKYLGFDKAGQEKLIKLPSRSVTIIKAPICVVYDGGCYLQH